MTDDSLLPFDLPAVRRKKVSAAFDGGLISSDGGLVLLREAVNRHSILTPNRRAKLTPLSGTAEVVPVVNRGDPRGFV